MYVHTYGVLAVSFVAPLPRPPGKKKCHRDAQQMDQQGPSPEPAADPWGLPAENVLMRSLLEAMPYGFTVAPEKCDFQAFWVAAAGSRRPRAWGKKAARRKGLERVSASLVQVYSWAIGSRSCSRRRLKKRKKKKRAPLWNTPISFLCNSFGFSKLWVFKKEKVGGICF